MADDPKGRFGFGSSSIEQAETLDVSGGTHKSCGESIDPGFDLVGRPVCVVFNLVEVYNC